LQVIQSLDCNECYNFSF